MATRSSSTRSASATRPGWAAAAGFLDQMRVIEKFTRTGNELLYEVTVEDPEVLVKPWVMPARTLRISNPVIVAERGSCTESELKRSPRRCGTSLGSGSRTRLSQNLVHGIDRLR